MAGEAQITDHHVSLMSIFFFFFQFSFLPEGRTKRYFPVATLGRKNRWMEYVRRACGSENLYLVAVDSLASLIFSFLLKPLKID